MFKNYVCPNGLPPAECGHIPQLIKNAEGFLTKLLVKSKVPHAVNLPTAQQVRAEHQLSDLAKEATKPRSQRVPQQRDRMRSR